MRWTPRLRTVLLIVNVVILAMPLAAIAGLQIYDSELVRQTEAELIAQGAFVDAAYRNALLEELTHTSGSSEDHGRPAQHAIEMVDGKFIPVAPRLDISKERVRPPAPDPTAAVAAPSAITLAAGARVEKVLKEAQRITFAGIRVVDVDGTIVASTGENQRGRAVADHEEVRRALAGEFVSILRQRISASPLPPLESISRRTKIRVFVAMPVLIDDRVVGAVVLSRTPMSMTKALYDNRLVFMAMLMSLLGGVALITLLTAVTIRRPIRALIEQARRISDDTTQGTVIERPGTVEFEELSEAFAKMAAALGQREAYITTFARAVSHEFKTPLSSIRGSVELLQDHLDEMDVGERDEFLEVVAKDCERLDRLVGGLLELARADVLRPGAESADVHAVITSIAESLTSATFDVEVTASDSGGIAAMSVETLESIISNLLGNAREHGAARALVDISTAGDRIEVRVSDDGPGIDASHVDRIFEEFFTTARDHGGTGLGLSIVRALLEAHGGSIDLVDPSSACFVIRLPAAPL